MRARDARPPSPLPWIAASAIVLGALAFAARRLGRVDPPAVALDEGAWARAVRPMLASRCGACHFDASRPFRLARAPAATEVIEELARARAWVTPGDPDGSALLRRARGERHPPSLPRGGCVDLALARWISGGSPARCADDAAPRGLAPDRAARDAVLARLDLATPERALATQLALIRAADHDALRATFLPAARLALTERALAECRLAIVAAGREVAPDWSRGTSVVEGGATVRRLAVLRPGDPPVGFHQVDGRWLADGLWCAHGLSP